VLRKSIQKIQFQKSRYGNHLPEISQNLFQTIFRTSNPEIKFFKPGVHQVIIEVQEEKV